MAVTYVDATVTGPGGVSVVQRFLVDSGASYSLLPEETWKKLGLTPKRKAQFSLADGTQIEREISEAHFSFQSIDGHSPVILGETGDEALLGVITLETLGLVLNPFQRTLQPMRLLLA
jgi:clan AA aspartic protease